ncbi:1-aminocyclopropane-1-carboxylate deaminase/D-cysteine desulfhydrase [Kangiella sp. TOML190]|uniref:1-aminocyclopropane-1-carboxylate deaminase/D-cysteine desulfhydrase n=1 Tax=Kangiella sp. TOML190 TaxID=2931351 RepID=UPI00203F5A2F|nr:pyridoxal-phosphate dependent enzyme [Kangiella sp. TOML190]
MFSRSPIQRVQYSLFQQYQVTVDVKRDDLIHPVISGNKWRKLKYLLEDADNKNAKTIISMGGNYSNHLHALAFAGKHFDYNTIGLVRAHPEQALTPTLDDCQKWGMQLEFIDRTAYADLRKQVAWDSFSHNYANSYWLGEGGFSPLAIGGVSEIGAEVEQQASESYDYVFCGLGSGATMIGLAAAFPKAQVIGVAAFKGAEYLSNKLAQQFPKLTNWQLATQFHCGGFAKLNSELELLTKAIEANNDFRLDKVYNAKVFLALESLIKQQVISANSRVLVIHTGGLQGNRAMSSNRV